MLQGTFGIRKIQVAEDGQVAPRKMVARKSDQRRFVTVLRIRETPIFPMDDTELGERDGMAGAKLEGLLQMFLSCVQVPRLMVGDTEINAWSADHRRL